MGQIYYSILSNLFLMLLTVFLLQEYFNIFLCTKSTTGKLKVFCAWIIYSLIQLWIPRYIENSMATMSLQLGSLLIVSFMIYRDKFVKKLYVCISILCIGAVVEMIVYCCTVKSFDKITIWRLVCSVVSKIILLVIIQVIKFVDSKKNSEIVPVFYYIILLFIPIGSIFIVYTIYHLLPYAENKILGLLSGAAIMTVLLLDTFTLFVYQKIVDNIVLREEKVRYNQQIELMKCQFNERINSYNDMRRFKHDMKNYFLTIQEYICKNRINEMSKYIDNILTKYVVGNHKEISKTGNILIDAIINKKYTEALRYGVKFILQVEFPASLEVSDIEISVILGNALDNAIEAVKTVEQERRYVDIKIFYKNGNLFIQIKNPYNGTIMVDNNKILTSKADKKVHGIGLESIKKAVEHFSGTIDIDYANSIFDLNMLLYL